MLWDPVFGWDWDRIRLLTMTLGFLYLFTGFISATEGGEFLDPTFALIVGSARTKSPFSSVLPS